MCMWDVVSITEPIARRDYDCQAWPWFDLSDEAETDLSEDDRQIIERARADNFKILKGQRYYCMRGKFNGEWGVYRAKRDMNDLCERLGLFRC